MPFNEKGEFIRSPARAVQANRSQRRHAATSTSSSISREDLITIAKGLAAVALLAGLIWLVVVFREWIVIGLGLWLISKLRSWLRS
ncbi:MAG: hypothetical protein VKK94_05735 [Cyanobacteriota bacterium]|nr:hypothetical protein [Cyanobacteriota bacterium]